MVIDLAAYRQKKAQRAMVPASWEQQERLVVNSGLARVIPVQVAVPVAPIASPELSDVDGDFAAFHALAYALATQI